MPTIVFNSKNRPSKTVEVADGGALADVCDDHEAPIPFSCRSASCGTCCIEVLEGSELLTAPEEEELDVLDAIGNPPPKFRLTCCAKFKAGPGRLVVLAQEEY
jgi:ferredoxin